MQDQIKFAIEATLFELKDDPTLAQRVRRKDLKTAAWSRLRGAGFLVECPRCGGTGYFGPSTVYGGTCYRCGGSKYAVPRFDRKWRERVLAYDWREYMNDIRKRR